MPFDAADVPTETDLYLRRREAACALWESLDPHRFDLNCWQSGCGTIACAMGWLAVMNHDGWFMAGGVPVRNVSFDEWADPFLNFARYFGLLKTEAIALFGGEGHYTAYWNVSSLPVRPEHVAAQLRAAPVRTRDQVDQRAAPGVLGRVASVAGGFDAPTAPVPR